jgi:N-acetylglucosaminyldiphosphoundecaprenol N-acetyl-beta-D-mannosaminyltransferase
MVRGVPLHAVTERQTVDFIMDELSAGRGGWVVTHNLDHLRRRLADPEFARICASADLVVADGMPLVWASRLRRRPLPERVAGSNLVSSLGAAAASAGRSLYLLGGAPGTATAAAAALRARVPGVRVAGTTCPEPGFEGIPGRLEEIAADLVAAAPDIVLVALGSPKQERLIESLRGRLPGAWWLGVGISFSFLAGDLIRAPA